MEELKQDIVGKAKYIGGNSKMRRLFSEFTPLYNTEGFYVRTKEGEQVIISGNQWEISLDSR